MISRAACAPRICLACRSMLAHRGADLGFRALGRTDVARRFYASHDRDLAMIEALIAAHKAEQQSKSELESSNSAEARKLESDKQTPQRPTQNTNVRKSVLVDHYKPPPEYRPPPKIENRMPFMPWEVDDASHGRGARTKSARSGPNAWKRGPRSRGDMFATSKSRRKQENPIKKKEDVERMILGDVSKRPPKPDVVAARIDAERTGPFQVKGSTLRAVHGDVSKAADKPPLTTGLADEKIYSKSLEDGTAGHFKSQQKAENSEGEQVSSELPISLEDAKEDQLEETPGPEVTQSNETEPGQSEDSTEETPSKIETPKVWHHELLQDRELGVPTLGMPAAALVIKNPNKMRLPRKAMTEMEELTERPGTEIDWEGLIPREGHETINLPDEVMANIEELRPKQTKVLRLKEFQKLGQALCDGFKKTQLDEYFKGHYEIKPSKAEILADYTWVKKVLPWAPKKRLELGAMPPKPLIATKIMHSIWGIHAQEEISGLGQMFVWIRPNMFPFLVNGSQSLIEQLRGAFLDEASNEKISTTSSDCRLNITARKPATYALLERLDQLLKSMVVETLNLKRYTKEIPSDQMVTELARITNTHIKSRTTKKGTALEVSWIPETRLAQLDAPGQKSPASDKLENLAQVVLRLLVRKPVREFRYGAQAIPEITKDAPTPGVFVRYHRETRSMGWRDRLQPWSRYVQSSQKTPGDEPLDLSTLSFPEYREGIPGAVHSTTATFGHVLHSEVSYTLDDIMGKRRVLAPAMPHPAAFAGLKPDNDQDLTQSTAIILNFMPPAEKSEATRMFRLRLPVNADADLSNFTTIPADATLHVVRPSHLTDVMLPTQSVDIRLARELLFELDIEKQESLKDFIAKSEFNLIEGRLRTPARVSIIADKRHMNANLKAEDTEVEKPKKRASKKTEADKAHDECLPHCMFVGLEVHQTIDMPWKGHTLRYTTIEAGQHGGQRQELSLHYNGDNFEGDDRTRFLQLAGEIATGEHFSWREGFKAMKTERFEDHSYDLPTDELADEFADEPETAPAQRPYPRSAEPFDDDDVRDSAQGYPVPAHARARGGFSEERNMGEDGEYQQYRRPSSPRQEDYDRRRRERRSSVPRRDGQSVPSWMGRGRQGRTR